MNALPLNVVEKVKDHIRIFPPKESHYKNVKYLPEYSNIKKMYNMFKEKYPSVRILYTLYLYIFNYNFKLAFSMPQVDVCGECEMLNTKLKIKITGETLRENLKVEKAVHLCRSKKLLGYEAGLGN